MIRQLMPSDADAYSTLRHEALLREPFSFGSSPDEDVMRSLDFVRSMLSDERQAVFGAFAPDLVGAVGVRGLPRKKVRHKAVTERAVSAAKLYDKLGFVAWAVEPAALSVDGVDVCEHHMILKLEK